jgi:ribosomal protein L32
MKCPRCGTENRSDLIFCEECGFRLAEVVLDRQRNACPSCGFANEPHMRFCLECGASLGAPPLGAPPLGASHPSLPSSFSEGAAQGTPPASVWTCATCGHSNRTEHRFCGECGQPRPVPAPTPPPLGAPPLGAPHPRLPSRISEGAARGVSPAAPVPAPARTLPWRWVLVFGGGAAVVLLIAAAVTVLIMRQETPVITDYGPIMEAAENQSVEHAQKYVDDWAPWADSEAAAVTSLRTEEGPAYMMTYEQEAMGDSDFNPRFVVIVDPVTGETSFALAP